MDPLARVGTGNGSSRTIDLRLVDDRLATFTRPAASPSSTSAGGAVVRVPSSTLWSAESSPPRSARRAGVETAVA